MKLNGYQLVCECMLETDETGLKPKEDSFETRAVDTMIDKNKVMKDADKISKEYSANDVDDEKIKEPKKLPKGTAAGTKEKKS